MNNTESSFDSMRVFLENMLGEAELARRSGIDFSPSQIVDASIDRIRTLAEESLPLAKLLDSSDVVFHAEGPGANHDLPWLSSLNWITTSVEKNLRWLSGNVLDLLDKNGQKLARQLDFRLTGMAPGSIWIGTKLMPPASDIWEEDTELSERLVGVIKDLPKAAAYIDDEEVFSSIQEFIPDPALRDALLNALLNFSPTGKKGIHTMGLSAKDHGTARLSQRERVVLREALRKPLKGDYEQGSLIGEVREADLDKTRFHLKTPEGVVRCVTKTMTAQMARNLIGHNVEVTGRYQRDRFGRPRLMYVEAAVPKGQTGELRLT